MNLRSTKGVIPSLFILLSLVYTFPFLIKYNYLGVRDWDLFTTITAVPVGSLLDYGQFPFWNPYLGGGNILFHHPETAVLSPFMILHLIFGAVIGLKLQVLICYFLGFFGTYMFMRRLEISEVASAAGAVVYFGSVHFALHFAEGHMPFTHFCFMPWFLYFIHKSVENTKFTIPAAVSLALMIIGNGAAIPLLYTLTFSSILFLLWAFTQRNLIYLRNYILSSLMAILLSAVKFVPMVIYLYQNKWSVNSDESIPLSALGNIFFGLKHSLFAQNFAGQVWGWHEYGAYISPLVVLLAVFSLAKCLRKHFVWLLLLIFFLILGLGNFGSYSLWALLSKLPGYSSARCTGRSFQMVIFCSAILGAFGWDYLNGILRKNSVRLVTYIPMVLLLIIVGTNVWLAYPVMDSAFTERPVEIVRHKDFKHVVDEKSHAYKNYLANRGSLVAPWLSAYHESRGLVGPFGNVFEEYILDGKAEIIKRDYTPNRIEYVINGIESGKIVIGMGDDRGWTAGTVSKLPATGGLITVPFETGEQGIILRYRTPYFISGLILSVLSMIALGIYWKRS